MSDCVRCGYCCKALLVVIVDNPDLGIRRDNLICYDGSSQCKHLVGDTPGEYSCAIHDREWCPKTPCAEYNSEEFVDTPCKLGEYIISKHKQSLK